MHRRRFQNHPPPRKTKTQNEISHMYESILKHLRSALLQFASWEIPILHKCHTPPLKHSKTVREFTRQNQKTSRHYVKMVFSRRIKYTTCNLYAQFQPVLQNRDHLPLHSPLARARHHKSKQLNAHLFSSALNLYITT